MLDSVLAEFGCQTGTIHRAIDGDSLELVCQVGVPEALMDKISLIPFGKGIAGAAAATQTPVELCNLQMDLGGIAKIGARQTGVAGSLAVPVFDPSSGKVSGTVGIGKYVPYDFTDAEMLRLEEIARNLALHFAQSGLG